MMYMYMYLLHSLIPLFSQEKGRKKASAAKNGTSVDQDLMEELKEMLSGACELQVDATLETCCLCSGFNLLYILIYVTAPLSLSLLKQLVRIKLTLNFHN